MTRASALGFLFFYIVLELSKADEVLTMSKVGEKFPVVC